MRYNPSLERTATKEWSLRNEILSITHQWPRIILFCLIGCLAGWAVSWIWPSSFRAREDLYVGLNIYRWEVDRNPQTFAEEVSFNYPDDYKNWQMSNLNAFVLGQNTVRRTLEQLQAQDPYWESVDLSEFTGLLRVFWRNAGRWTLAVDHPDAKRAAQAVSAWKSVILEGIHSAVASAQDTLAYDYQLQEISANQVAVTQRLAKLNQTQSSLTTISQELAGMSGVEDPQTHWRILAAATKGADFSPAWTELLNSAPEMGSPLEDYIAWVEGAQILVDEEILSLQEQAAALDKAQAEAAGQYARASRASLGFSANMVVEPISDEPPQTSKIRPVPLLMLVGGVFGFMTWILVEILRLTSRLRA